MAKSRNRKKKKKPVSRSLCKVKPENYIKKTARKFPIDACIVNADWEESNMAVVIMVRKRLNDTYLIGSFIVDTGCLGVKDTFFVPKMEEYELEELIEHYTEKIELEMIEVDKDLACSIVYGAVEYANNLGFHPHKEYAVTKYVLEPESAIERIPIEFGQDGKPYFFAGPYDNVDQILAKLDKAVGRDNYNYTLEIRGNDDFYLEDDNSTAENLANKFESLENQADRSVFAVQMELINIIGDRIDLNISQIDTLLEGDIPENIIDEIIDSFEEDEIDFFLSEHILYATFLLTIKKLKEYQGPTFLLDENYLPFIELDSVIDDLPSKYKILFVLDSFVFDTIIDNLSKFDNLKILDNDLVEDLANQILKKMEKEIGAPPSIEISNYIKEQLEDKILKTLAAKM